MSSSLQKQQQEQQGRAIAAEYKQQQLEVNQSAAAIVVPLLSKRVAIVEDDDDEMLQRRPSSTPMLKVVRPIPQRIAQDFYEQAHAKGLSAREIHAAVLLAHEWHRKWTQQEETGHGYHDVDLATTTAADAATEPCTAPGAIPEPYAFRESAFYDRESGARNPSPLDDDDEDDDVSAETEESDVADDDDGFFDFLNNDPRTNASKRSREMEDVDEDKEGDEEDDIDYPFQNQFYAGREEQLRFLGMDASDGEDSEEVRASKRRQFSSTLDQDEPAAVVEDDDDEDEVVVNKQSLIRPVAIRVSIPEKFMQNLPKFGFGYGTSTDDDDFDVFEPMIPRDIIRPQGPLPFSRDAASTSLDGTSPLTCCTIKSVSVGDLLGLLEEVELEEDIHAPSLAHRIEDDDNEREDEDSEMKQFQDREDPSNMVYELPEGVLRPSPVSSVTMEFRNAREGLLHSLAVSGGETDSAKFLSCLDVLKEYYQTHVVDNQDDFDGGLKSEGMWLILTKPTFFGQISENSDGDPLYTLGRMSFDMFSPTNLICSLQGNFKSIDRVLDPSHEPQLEYIPKSLKNEVASGQSVLRTYNIVTAFTIEPALADFPNAPNKDAPRSIRGIMTTYGFTLPDPHVPNRQSVWITGGRIEPNNDEADQVAWKRQFQIHPPKHNLGEQAKLLAVKLLMGADIDKTMAEDGSLEYRFTRPIGGHGLAYVDTLFVDDSLRIVRGHRGTIFVSTRLPDVPAYK